MQQTKGVDDAVRFLPENIRQQVSPISSLQKLEIEEIRFRLGQPIAVVTQRGMRYIDKGKLIPFIWRPNLPVLNRDEIDGIFMLAVTTPYIAVKSRSVRDTLP